MKSVRIVLLVVCALALLVACGGSAATVPTALAKNDSPAAASALPQSGTAMPARTISALVNNRRTCPNAIKPNNTLEIRKA